MSVEITEGGEEVRKARATQKAAPQENGRYQTTDIEMAATLITIGHKFLHINERKEKKQPKRIVFVFEHNAVKDDLTRWLNGDLSVDPRLLLNNLSDLKNLVHNKGFV
jgi:hypothetical protein